MRIVAALSASPWLPLFSFLLLVNGVKYLKVKGITGLWLKCSILVVVSFWVIPGYQRLSCGWSAAVITIFAWSAGPYFGRSFNLAMGAFLKGSAWCSDRGTCNIKVDYYYPSVSGAWIRHIVELLFWIVSSLTVCCKITCSWMIGKISQRCHSRMI